MIKRQSCILRCGIWLLGAVLTAGCAGPIDHGMVGDQGDEAVETATIQVDGVACPFCIRNVDRSLSELEGVAAMRFDLESGRATVTFRPGLKPSPLELWQAVLRSGFTPRRVEIDGNVYEGPQP